jgi:pimeloyl-ACP methyl ester carboxylesterase
MTDRIVESLRLPHPAGGELAVDLAFTLAPGEPAVVYLHGLGSVRNSDKAQALAAACARRGWTFAAVDCRGHGQSTGQLVDLRCSGLLADMRVFGDFLRERGIGAVHAVGSSMGAWTAAWWALTSPDFVLSLGLIAPALLFPHGFWNRLTPAEQQAWRTTGRHRFKNQWLETDFDFKLIEDGWRYPVAALCSRWRRPALVFHGMADDVVPYRQMLDAVEDVEAPVEIRLWRTGDHRLIEYKDVMAEALCNFVGQTL